MFHHCAVIIPAYKPDSNLLLYISTLKKQGIQHIIVVDDGSGEHSQSIFEKLKTNECTLLTHSVNRGKGRALKTAFQHVMKEETNIHYIVTADADGQHATTDVIALFESLKENNSGIVLGVRNFDEKQVPMKNAWGNRLTSILFWILFRKKVSDTQTGLRGFSVNELDWLLLVKGERFEYEMNMLIYAVYSTKLIYEVPIETIYFGEEHSTHYKPLQDSGRIAKQLFIGRVMKNRLLEDRPMQNLQ